MQPAALERKPAAPFHVLPDVEACETAVAAAAFHRHIRCAASAGAQERCDGVTRDGERSMTDVTTAIGRLSSALSSRYRIERELGRGGMATVYLAEDLKHHRQVAVKVLHPDLAAALGPERFLREVEIAARLQHPHILTLIDSGEVHEGHPDQSAGRSLLYYVMPFVDGPSLRTRIASERELPIGDVLHILRDVAEALAEAHARGVVHRDIKPDNVLLRGHHAVVTDFGIAKAVGEATGHHQLTSVGVTLGTPAYMAPEQAAGDPAADHRVDIYALGVMAYEMLTGAPPFTGRTPQSVLAAHMTQPPVPVTSHRAVPAPIAEVIMRCLEKDPTDRWQSADALLTQLEGIASPSANTPLPPSPRVASAGPSRWSSKHIAALALIAGLAIVGVAAYTLRAREASVTARDPTRPPTVVVLPFENLGAPNDEYFADGMTEELTGRLAKLSGLAVIARTSAIQYKKTTKPITQIAKELGADFLVEGTVRWEKTPDGGGRVRVAPQVIRASDGTHVWADRFDKPYGTDIFGIQSDIAEQVARALDVTLHPADQRVMRQVPTTNLAAYDAYLRAQSYLDRDFGANWDVERLVIESLEHAVRLDSGFAAAHALLAWMHFIAMRSGYDISLGTGIQAEQRWEMARSAAERAIAADSMSATAHRVLSLYYAAEGDTARQRAELAFALRGEPSSPQALVDRGYALIAVGRTEDGLREVEHAVNLDPRNARRWQTVAFFHRRLRNFVAAKTALDRAIAVAPTEPVLYVDLAWLHLMQDRRDDARAALRHGIAEAGVNKVLFRIAQTTGEVNMIRILHEDLAEPAARLTLKEFGADSVDYYEAKVRAYRLDPVRSRAYFDSIVAWSVPRATKVTRDPVYKLELAYGLAGAGRRDEAARALRPLINGQELRVSGALMVTLAEACVRTGNFDCAVANIAGLLAQPEYAPAIFRLDPVWDPLRGRADFRKLVEQR